MITEEAIPTGKILEEDPQFIEVSICGTSITRYCRVLWSSFNTFGLLPEEFLKVNKDNIRLVTLNADLSGDTIYAIGYYFIIPHKDLFSLKKRSLVTDEFTLTFDDEKKEFEIVSKDRKTTFKISDKEVVFCEGEKHSVLGEDLQEVLKSMLGILETLFNLYIKQTTTDTSVATTLGLAGIPAAAIEGANSLKDFVKVKADIEKILSSYVKLK